MTINSIIAKWLGYEYKFLLNDIPFYVKSGKLVGLDFINDRNQQKLIHDELKKKGYKIVETESLTFNSVAIFRGEDNYPVAAKSNEKDLDITFIEAMMQLIENENEMKSRNVEEITSEDLVNNINGRIIGLKHLCVNVIDDKIKKEVIEIVEQAKTDWEKNAYNSGWLDNENGKERKMY
jgi:hypothetical protein